MSKMRWETPVVVPVEGQMTINNRVHLLAAVDLPKHGIKKGQKVGKTISVKAFYALSNPKTVTL